MLNHKCTCAFPCGGTECGPYTELKNNNNKGDENESTNDNGT